MARRSLSRKARLLLFLDAGGLCHICGGLIRPGDAWEVEHVIPLAQGGEDGGDNLRPAHIKCHRTKTSRDVADTARAKRREAAHLGIRKTRTPIKGWRRFDGTPVRNPRA